jgi:hypothetical protein
MKAIFQKQVVTVEDTMGDYVILRTDPWATTMVPYNHRDLVIDPTDDEVATVESGGELHRCSQCEALDCCCAEVGSLMDEIGLTKGLVN